MSAEDEIEDLRAQVTGQQLRHARAVAGVQQAEARAAALREGLLAEFGTGTLAEARDLLVQLDLKAEEQAGEVRRLLERAGGSL